MGAAAHYGGTPSWSRQRLKLHGPQVDKWFTSAGWSLQGVATRHAFIDELITPRVVARRVWHTPLEFRALPRQPADAPSGVAAWLQVDGDLLVFDRSRAPLSIPAGFAFFHAARPMAVQSARPTARIEVVVPQRSFDARELPQLLRRADSSTWAALASVINAIFNAPQNLDPRTLSLYAHSIETLTEAMWLESSSVPLSVEQDTYTRALQLISDHWSDPTFNVSALAHRLGVTRAHVTRIFRQRGAMPSAVIKQERIINARRMLASDPTLSFHTIAASTGFSSPRHLRESLRAPS